MVRLLGKLVVMGGVQLGLKKRRDKKQAEKDAETEAKTKDLEQQLADARAKSDKLEVDAVEAIPISIAPIVILIVTIDHLIDAPEARAHGIIPVRKGEIVYLVEGDLSFGLGGAFHEYVRVTHKGRTGLVSKYCCRCVSIPDQR